MESTLKTTPPDYPDTLQEYLWYCRFYEADIPVRVKRNGRYERVNLAELDAKQWGYVMAQWLRLRGFCSYDQDSNQDGAIVGE